MDNETETKLAPPGAGLPALELFIARRLFALKRLLGNRASFTAKFEQERTNIRRLVESCDATKRGRRVLIPRLHGLEDSSRYWSVWMTLDHLRITNQSFALVITSLAHGKVPSGEASTAAVKPALDVTVAVEEEFERSCDAVLTTVAAVLDLKTAARYAHPWFGPLDAAGWQAISATHMGIHRAQIASILARISDSTPAPQA